MKKSDKVIPFTYKGHLNDICNESNKVNNEEIEEIISNTQKLANSLSSISPLFSVVDYTQSNYRLMTDNVYNIVGETSQSFYEGGLEKVIDGFQKNDFKIYNEQIFKTNRDFLQSVPINQHHHYIFSNNYRMKHKDGRYIPVHQKVFYITAKDTGLPLFAVCMVYDISFFKKDTVIHHSIEKISNQGVDLLQQNFYFPDEEAKLISPQERRVLQYIAEGSSSKQIADLLFISENTVITHRKSLLRKTNTQNMAELVAYAIKKNII